MRHNADDTSDIRFTPSIFDRISKSGKKHPDEETSYSIEELKASIRKNIELILNSRSQVSVLDPSFSSVRHGFHFYGMSDYSLRNLSDKNVAEEFAKEAEKAILLFEPRLKNVKINFESEKKASKNNSFHLKISAELKTQDLQKNESDLAFNTTLVPIKRVFDINISK